MKKIFLFISIVLILVAAGCSKKSPTDKKDDNTPPISHAGHDQSVKTGTTVTLDGSKSSDADKHEIKYNWSIDSKPDGSKASLSGETTIKPQFTADKDGEYGIKLTVVDEKGDKDSSMSTIYSATGNSIPISNAGLDGHNNIGDTIYLDGSKSNDPDFDNLSFMWSTSNIPTASSISLSDSTTSHPHFIADKAGEYKFELIVSDGDLSSNPDLVTITVTATSTNTLPVSNAGHARTVHVGDVVTLDGTGSSDADGDKLSYDWHVLGKPDKSSFTLDDKTIASPTFTLNEPGVFVFELVVNDGTENSSPSSVTITVADLDPKEQLMNMGLNASDADYLIANHNDEVKIVLADDNRIYKNMPPIDNMFALGTDPDGGTFSDVQMINWTEDLKTSFKKMFGRFVFVINSPKFIQSFNDNIGLLNTAYQGNPPAIPFPKNYDEFRAAANNAIVAGNYQHKFFISERASWQAWGVSGLKLKMEKVMFGKPADGAPHNTEALILHEITHAWGYAHSAADETLVTLKPNNIPYYVQFIVGSSYLAPQDPMEWDTPDGLLTIYFGNYR